MIRITDVVKDFDGFRALNHLDMHVPEGAIYGLVGPNVPRYEQETGSLFRHLQLWRELYT